MGYLIGTLYATMVAALFIGYIIYRRSNLRAEYRALKETNEKLKKQQEEEITFTKKLLTQQEEIEKGIADACKKREAAQQRAAEAQSATEQLLAAEQRRLAAEVSKQKEIQNMKLTLEMGKRREDLEALYNTKNKDLERDFITKQAQILGEIEAIQYDLDQFKAKQDAINEAIRRAEELQNEMDMHRIILTDNNKEDISYLVSIEQNIHNKDLLYKLIWSEYIQKPFNQMIKNIFGNRSPKNVIYCIENITTHKKYIGKTSAEVTKRWTDHLKNSLNIGGIKRQPIHDALFGHWDEFTFSIIEEVKDDKLSEREKYYISFFETDKYGYNVKGGG